MFTKRVRENGLIDTLPHILGYIGIPYPKHTYFGIINGIRFADSRIYTSCDINKVLPKSTNMPHPVGIVIGSGTKIGENVQIRQNVTLGGRGGDHPDGQPIYMMM